MANQVLSGADVIQFPNPVIRGRPIHTPTRAQETLQKKRTSPPRSQDCSKEKKKKRHLRDSNSRGRTQWLVYLIAGHRLVGVSCETRRGEEMDREPTLTTRPKCQLLMDGSLGRPMYHTTRHDSRSKILRGRGAALRPFDLGEFSSIGSVPRPSGDFFTSSRLNFMYAAVMIWA